jgi:hypothetical protein
MDELSVKNEPDDTVSVELPRKHKGFVLALLALLLVVYERISVWTGNHPYHQSGETYYILLTTGAILLGLISFWRALARYWIRVSPGEVTLDITALGLHETRRFARSEVANLRVDEQRIFTYRPWLAFDRNGKRKFIGEELDEWKLDGLLDPIYLRFPEIAPEKRVLALSTTSQGKR